MYDGSVTAQRGISPGITDTLFKPYQTHLNNIITNYVSEETGIAA